MPYHLEKGPVFATLEAVYNDPQRLRPFLHNLWQGKADVLGGLGVLASPMYDDTQHPQNTNATGDKRLASMREHWFGESPPKPRPDFGFPPSGALSTGYWARYHGDVRQIVAETLMSAGEVALGVDRPADPAAAGPPAVGRSSWPVEFFWKCGQPRFEGWVTWRDHQNGGGQVTVILATPATPYQVLSRPARGAVEVKAGTWQQQWQGMWICCHEDHEQWVMVTSWPTASGHWDAPLDGVMYTQGIGPVGRWAPEFGNGGPAPTKLQFVPGP